MIDDDVDDDGDGDDDAAIAGVTFICIFFLSAASATGRYAI